MSQLWTNYDAVKLKATEQTRESDPALRFYAELFVENSPAEVWSFFTDLTKWTLWSPICIGCRLTGPGDLRLGSVLEIGFKVMGVNLTGAATVIQFDPSTNITWQAEKFGVRATHSYRLIPRDRGTLLCNEETFVGLDLPLRVLISAWYRASKLSGSSLAGLSRELAKRRPEISQ